MYHKIPDVAAHLNMSRKAVRKLIEDCTLVAIDVTASGKRKEYRVSDAEIQRFEDARAKPKPLAPKATGVKRHFPESAYVNTRKRR